MPAPSTLPTSNPANSNDSTAAGFIAPSTVPIYDQALDDALQAAIKGICNIPGWLVRPRVQNEPANQPDANVDWVALGVVKIEQDFDNYEGHRPGDDGLGFDVVRYDEVMDVMLSFIGPNANLNHSVLRVGLQIAQNRVTLQGLGLEFVEFRPATNMTTTIKNVFVRRVDATLVVRRRAEFLFPIRNVESASFKVNTDVGISSTTIVSQ